MSHFFRCVKNEKKTTAHRSCFFSKKVEIDILCHRLHNMQMWVKSAEICEKLEIAKFPIDFCPRLLKNEAY